MCRHAIIFDFSFVVDYNIRNLILSCFSSVLVIDDNNNNNNYHMVCSLLIIFKIINHFEITTDECKINILHL